MNDPEKRIRTAALLAIEKLSAHWHGRVPWSEIAKGFVFDGESVLFANRAKGIFKPKQMTAALSIKSGVPRSGRPIWYRDQIGTSDHYDETGLMHYELSRPGPADPTNRALKETWKRNAPMIYFAGVAPTVYQAVFPVWIEDFRDDEGIALVSSADVVDLGLSSVAAAREMMPLEVRSSYSPRISRNRNHQAWFSARIKAAYGWRCSFSGLPIRKLLVGAHIVPDAEGGPASVQNGICMSALHHVAFDTDLLGVDPDFRVHTSPRIREQNDGEILVSLKNLDGAKIRLPDESTDLPSRDLLAQRFNQFRQTFS